MSRPHLASWSTLPEAGSTDWRHDSACLAEDPELFFPIGNTGPAVVQIAEAKQVCNTRCTVRQECLDHALDNGITDGVWGGLSEDERKSLKRRDARRRRSEGGPTSASRPEMVVPRGDFVDAGPVREVLAEAQARGWGQSKIAVALQLDLRIVRQVLNGDQERVTESTVKKVTDGIPALAGHPPTRATAQPEVSV